MKKVIKTFTVDEEVYNWLVEMLRQADIGFGVSSLLDGYLKYLYQGLREIFNYLKKNKIEIPLSYVVHRYIDDHALFFQYDWEALEKLDKSGKSRREIDQEIEWYVNDLIEDFKKKHKGRWIKKTIKTEIPKVDRG